MVFDAVFVLNLPLPLKYVRAVIATRNFKIPCLSKKCTTSWILVFSA